MSWPVQRFTAQLLAGPPETSVAGVARRLLAVQAQDPRGARMAVRARSAGLAASDVDHALTVDRSVVVGWLNRGTLHLVRSGDYWWLHALTAPSQLAGNARRLRQEGVDASAAERGVRAVTDALAHGPLVRADLRERAAAAGVRVEGQALVHVLLLASLRGLVVRGPVVGREQAFVLARDWLGDPPDVDREAALRELAHRYLAGHGPADERDLARWAGVSLGDARRGLRSVPGLVQHGDGLVDVPGRGAAAGLPRPRLPPPRLLGAFDPLLLGWTSREPVLGGHAGLVTSNGVFRPFALVGGRAVATWALVRGRVVLKPLSPLAPGDVTALDADARQVERFLTT